MWIVKGVIKLKKVWSSKIWVQNEICLSFKNSNVFTFCLHHRSLCTQVRILLSLAPLGLNFLILTLSISLALTICSIVAKVQYVHSYNKVISIVFAMMVHVKGIKKKKKKLKFYNRDIFYLVQNLGQILYNCPGLNSIA